MFDLQGLNVYLIGMMGSGKSTLGKLIAEQLGYGFIDTDTTIERLVGQTVTEIFQTVGEAEFRQLETQVLTEVSAYTRLTIATGGGIIINRENWGHLQQGLTIWLDPTIEIIIDRLQQDTTRPLLSSGTDLRARLQQLYHERRDRYAEADLHIPITENLPAPVIVEQVLAAIPSVLKSERSEPKADREMLP